MSIDNTSISRSLVSRYGILGIVLTVIGLIAIPMFITEMYSNVDAHEIVVVQAPFSGELTVITEAGWKLTKFGKVTRYPRQAQYSFSSAKDQGKSLDESIKTRFNDGGTAHLSGVLLWDMPLEPTKIIALHRRFSNFIAIEQQLIRPAIEKVVYVVGPTMSSTESSAERRPEIPQYIDDQLSNGPYLTAKKVTRVHDALTNTDKDTVVVEIAQGSDGHAIRSAPSAITDAGIHLYPVTIDGITYDDVVESQIKERQKATTQVQISQANARKAEQDAITTEQQGKANAAKAKWEQETINAKEVALAQKDLQVATLAAQTAEQYKKQQILEGEGEAEKMRLKMSANNALDAKLEAFVKVNEFWANAFSKFQGNVVPTTVFGASSGNNGSNNAAQNFMDLVTAKTAHDLSLDLSTTKGESKK